MKSWPLLVSVLALSPVAPNTANAQWISSGTPISAALFDQLGITICPDGAGGAIVAWADYRINSIDGDIYVQRINSSGVPQWTANGVAICTATGTQNAPRIAADGNGGAIIAWQDYRVSNADVFAQRVNASGVTQWAANGVQITNVSLDQVSPTIVPDGQGGAVIAWTDERNIAVSGRDIYAQRVSSAGASIWTAIGVALCTSSADQVAPAIVSDGNFGGIVTWRDSRNGASNYDVYAQRVSSAGVPQWTANGIAACSATNNQDSPVIVTDGAGGAIIAWQDNRTGTLDIFAQHLNGAGAWFWGVNGSVICNAASAQSLPVMVSDGNQGAIIAWTDNRNASPDIYAQRIGSAGNTLWIQSGNGICTNGSAQSQPQIVSDGVGGAILMWIDFRSAIGQLYSQRVDPSGAARWTSDGAQISNGLDTYNPQLTSDGAGNAIVGYTVYPNGADVYAQRIDGQYGYWGKPDPTMFAAKDIPNDQGGKVRLEWYGSGRDVSNQQVIAYYTVWRAIDQAAYATASQSGVPVVKLSDMTAAYKGRAIRREKAQAVDYFWELIGRQDAIYRYGYSFTALTSFDSTATNSATHRFQIVAHTYSQYINWPSNILSGRSVDNLAPPAPLFLTAQRIGSYVHLKWNGVHLPDLDKYTVYRKASTGVTAIPANFLADENDTLLTDSGAPASALYYIVTATDIHQNQGAKSNEAAVLPATGVGNLPPITALTVLQNHPNPFTSETQLQVGLPARGDVRMEVYDVAGKRVRTAVIPAQSKGWNTVRLSARDDRGALLPSGVYFYRIHAGGETVTKKMVIAR